MEVVLLVIIHAILAPKLHLALLVCLRNLGLLILAPLTVSAMLAISIITIQVNVLHVHQLIQDA
jgi:hypothetical protein